MRVVIDFQGGQSESRSRGIGRYSLSLLKAILRNKGEHEIIVVLSNAFSETIEPIRQELDGLIDQKNIRVWSAVWPVRECDERNGWRREAAELVHAAFIAELQPDVVHVASVFEGYIDDAIGNYSLLDKQIPVSASFYDLIPLINSSKYLEPNLHYAKFYKRKLDQLKRMDGLLTISKSASQEAIEYLQRNSGRVINVGAASDDRFHPIDVDSSIAAPLLRRFSLVKPFLMYSGAFDERKNHFRLIEAYAALPDRLRSSYQLAFVGGFPGDYSVIFEKKAIESGLANNDLIITGKVSDEEMNLLYNLCHVFVFPSWHEGFGLPVLEAMQCGKAVIASNTSSLPEVVDCNEALFDPFDAEDICRKLEEVLTEETFRLSLEKHGLEQSKKFDWDIVAKRAVNAFEILSKKRLQPRRIIKSKRSLSLESLVENISSISSITDSPSDQDLRTLASALDVSFPARARPRIYIDVSDIVIEDYKTGIQRVVRAIANELLKSPPREFDVEPVYLTDVGGEWHYRYATEFKAAYSAVDESDRGAAIDVQRDDFFLGLDLSRFMIHAEAVGLFDEWRALGVGVYFVVYDILPVTNPEWWPDGAGDVHRLWLEAIARASTGLIGISKAVTDRVEAWLDENPVERVYPLKLSWFHLGADIVTGNPTSFMPDDAQEVLDKIQKTSSFLMVGTVEPRKGHAQTLSAFEQLWAEGAEISLVIVGKVGWLVKEITIKLKNHQELNNRLFWLDGISDQYLEKVYAASGCLIAASEGEGFGLPLIEAAQHKKPLIARDIPVFREVAGEYAFYFKDSKDPQCIAETVLQWLELNAKAKVPRSDDMPWLTWKQSAQNLIDIVLEDHKLN
jgi:glycosyltransferase involved in cell wall biosynthesis